MVAFYAKMVAMGRITPEQVPPYWRDQVALLMGE